MYVTLAQYNRRVEVGAFAVLVRSREPWIFSSEQIILLHGLSTVTPCAWNKQFDVHKLTLKLNLKVIGQSHVVHFGPIGGPDPGNVKINTKTSFLYLLYIFMEPQLCTNLVLHPSQKNCKNLLRSITCLFMIRFQKCFFSNT